MKLKFLAFFCLVFVTFTSLIAQGYKYIYYFDVHLNPVSKSASEITGKGYPIDGLVKVDYFINATSTLLMGAHFTDSTLDTLQGLFRSYHANAVLQQEGNYVGGLKQGLWQKWDEDGLKTDSIIYEKDYKLRYAKFEHHNKDKSISSYAFTDSLQNTFVEKYISEKGIVTSEVNFYGQNGLLKIYDSTGVKISADSVFSREEREADFPGGRFGWNTYLKKNLRGDVPSNHGAPNGMYTVVVKFVITKDGKLADISTETNPGYGIANEAIRIIKESPNWIPAIQYGRQVNAYRRQPITFVVDNGR